MAPFTRLLLTAVTSLRTASRWMRSLALAAVFTLTPWAAWAGVDLQNGTGTFSQVNADFSPNEAIDGIFNDLGWAIARVDAFGGTNSETAVWETAADLSTGNLAFTMYFLHGNPGHLLGRFRLSVTTDDRSTFADGLGTGGDVDANWIVLTNPVVSGPAGMSFTTLADESVLAGGVTAGTGSYTVSYLTAVQGITGIRLEALEHPTLPGGDGPGLFPRNGNFILTELILNNPEPVPEPSTVMAFGLGVVCLLAYGYRKRSKLG